MPVMTKRAKALSGWAWSAASHAGSFNGVEISDRGGHATPDVGRQKSRHRRSAVYGYNEFHPVGEWKAICK